MCIYTIRKSDLYKSGIDPTCRLIEDPAEIKEADCILALARILMEQVSSNRNET